MTHAENQPASPKTVLAPDVAALDERSRRAWTEPMAVRPLPDGRYAVDSASEATYVVDLERGNCSCPDSAIRGELCKHARRVAIEINQGRLAAPDPPRCRRCGRAVADEPDDGPADYCADCRFEPGEVVYDRERGPDTPLLVVSFTDRRADEVEVDGTGVTVAEYGENRQYDPTDPVVEVVYPKSVGTRRSPNRYSFPASRLGRPDDAGRQATLAGSTA